MDLALNNLQRLICHKPKQPTNLILIICTQLYAFKSLFVVIRIDGVIYMGSNITMWW